MTTATLASIELAEKGAGTDVLRRMVPFMAQRLMERDVEACCGAGCDRKSPERPNSRNGHRERAWDTSARCVVSRRAGHVDPQAIGAMRRFYPALGIADSGGVVLP